MSSYISHNALCPPLKNEPEKLGAGFIILVQSLSMYSAPLSLYSHPRVAAPSKMGSFVYLIVISRFKMTNPPITIT